MRTVFVLPILIAACFAINLPAGAAQDATDYTPDIYEFNGGNSLVFEATPELNLAEGGTIEFWVVPDWTEDPGDDPAIVSNAGLEGPLYLIAMLRDRDGLALVAGQEEDVVTFDFDDGELHHVAVSQLADGVAVFVDGQLAGISELMFADLPSLGLWVGSIDGIDNQFVGAIAGLRFWRTVVEQENLVRFALADIFESDHPDLDALVAMSNFDEAGLLVVDDSALPRNTEELE